MSITSKYSRGINIVILAVRMVNREVQTVNSGAAKTGLSRQVSRESGKWRMPWELETKIVYKHSVLTNWGFYELTFLWDGPYFFKVNAL